MFMLGVFIFASLVLVIGVAWYLISELKEYRFERQEECKEFKIQNSRFRKAKESKQNTEYECQSEKMNANEDIPHPIRLAIQRVIDCKYKYIRNFHIFQISAKVFAMASLVYSIVGLIHSSKNITNAPGLESILACIVSLLSVIFVVLALYLSPVNRYKEHIRASKNANILMDSIKAKKGLYGELNKYLVGNELPAQNVGSAKSEKSPAEQHSDDIPEAEKDPSGVVEIKEEQPVPETPVQTLSPAEVTNTGAGSEDEQKTEIDVLKLKIKELLNITNSEVKKLEAKSIAADEAQKISKLLNDIEASLTTDEE